MGVLRQITETIMLRCSAAVEFGLTLLPQGRCSFGPSGVLRRAEATSFPPENSGRASVNDLGRRFEVGTAWHPFCYSPLASGGRKPPDAENQGAYAPRSPILDGSDEPPTGLSRSQRHPAKSAGVGCVACAEPAP